jgi:uncharacterized secreted repeat protein (TIGR03808 family)
MKISRRNVLTLAAALIVLPSRLYAAKHTAQLQALIDKAAKGNGIVSLAAGIFTTDTLSIDSTLKIEGVKGQTTLQSSDGSPILEIKNAANVSLSGMVFDSNNLIPDGKAGGAGGTSDDEAKFQVKAFQCADILIENCIFRNAKTSGLGLDACTGRVIGNQFYDIDQAALLAGRFSGEYRFRGLEISGNHIHNIGNNGIVIEHAATTSEDDSSIVTNNIIDGVRSQNGTGQHGNGIYIFASDNVIVNNNRISNTDYSGIRNTSSKQVIINSNMISRSSEVAIFIEYAFEAAVVDGNIVDQSFRGIEMSGGEGILGFNGICSNNIVRNTNRVTVNVGAGKHIGINVTAINTIAIGNIVETVGENEFGPGIGILFQDWSSSHSHAVRDNMIKNAPYGIGVILGEGATVISALGNSIAGAKSNVQLFDGQFGIIGGDQTVKNTKPDLLKLIDNIILK